ncbi:hypothetical protein CBR_g45982 [Chara braunii]|uniref:Secreted protein n=1 Tax=Chara braunii TaxID=69332 RepID=A0A388LZU8_CHABU|nr:hypothetical protein CBR_g45982 [Chara braunii]|eukprot:GBG87826.1 hypothetical protein CBR_g45982 [Chara braunii]
MCRLRCQLVRLVGTSLYCQLACPSGVCCRLQQVLPTATSSEFRATSHLLVMRSLFCEADVNSCNASFSSNAWDSDAKRLLFEPMGRSAFSSMSDIQAAEFCQTYRLGPIFCSVGSLQSGAAELAGMAI